MTIHRLSPIQQAIIDAYHIAQVDKLCFPSTAFWDIMLQRGLLPSGIDLEEMDLLYRQLERIGLIQYALPDDIDPKRYWYKLP